MTKAAIALLLAFCAVGSAFRPGMTRRDSVAAAALGIAGWGASAARSNAAGATVQNVEAFGEEARQLRQAVRDGGASSKARAEKELKTVLVPMQEAMLEVAGSNQKAKTQALLMKGHLLELDAALKANDWKPYVSKSTGRTYPGGKAERELEEVEETIEDFLTSLSA